MTQTAGSRDLMTSVPLSAGIRMAYREAGEGTTLVQIHGAGTGHKNFDLLTPHLAKKLHVIDVDLPGYGASEDAGHERSVYDFASNVADFVESAGLGRVTVHGSSMGGRIALALASRYPEVVDRLVVSCSFARPDKAALLMRESWKAAASYGGQEALINLTCLQGFSRAFWDRPDCDQIVETFVEAAAMSTPDGFIRDVNRTTKNVDLEPDVARIEAPTLLLAAEEDIMNPLRTAPSGCGMTDLHELIPNSELRILPGGHFFLFEYPEKIADEIISFVRSGRRRKTCEVE